MNNKYDEQFKLQRQNEVLRMRIAQNEKDTNEIISEKDEIIENLKDEREELEIKLSNQTDKIRQLEQTINRKDQEIGHLSKREGGLEQQITTLQAELQTQMKNGEQQQTRIDELNDELTDVKQELTDVKQEIMRLKSEKENTNEQRVSMKKYLNKLKEEFRKQNQINEEERRNDFRIMVNEMREIKTVTKETIPDENNATASLHINEAHNCQVTINSGSNKMNQRKQTTLPPTLFKFPINGKNGKSGRFGPRQ